MNNFFPVAPLNKNAKTMSGWMMTILGCASLGILWLLPYLFSPRGYIITEAGITIRQRAASLLISKDRIKSVMLLSSVKPGTGLNWLSGQFGYAGSFALEDGTTAQVYATRWDNMVQIRTVKGDPYLISPQDPEKFILHVNRLIK